ncbi:MAG: resolvase [Cyanobacteria bacterium DS2.008]|nr:resolvase [Cyanobacteria bacterium DS2.008]
MLIGYARVSTEAQNLDRQLGALRAIGCEKIFSEKASGRSTVDRPELERALDRLGHSDVLIVAEWDRATRSMLDGIRIMERVHARGAAIKVLDKPHLDLTTTIGKGLLAFLSALAQDERERIHARASEGRKAAKKRGARMGRKPKLDDDQVSFARSQLSNGASCRAVARVLKVHHATVSRLR